MNPTHNPFSCKRAMEGNNGASLAAEKVGDADPTIPSTSPALSPAEREREARALSELKERLSRVPAVDKSALELARRIRPDAVDDALLMRFLWAEECDVDVSLRGCRRT